MDKPVVLVACGAFNPPTLAHLRMMELARDFLRLRGIKVLCGYFTPVNDAYAKPDLAPAQHRLAMLSLAVQGSDWLRVCDWEALQPAWTPTLMTMQTIQERHLEERIMLVAGSDICNSFNIPNLWSNEHLQAICSERHGLILIGRKGFENYHNELLQNPITYRLQGNINFVHQPVENNLSSTKVRRLLRLGASIKWLVTDKVEEYIEKCSLYRK